MTDAEIFEARLQAWFKLLQDVKHSASKNSPVNNDEWILSKLKEYIKELLLKDRLQSESQPPNFLVYSNALQVQIKTPNQSVDVIPYAEKLEYFCFKKELIRMASQQEPRGFFSGLFTKISEKFITPPKDFLSSVNPINIISLKNHASSGLSLLYLSRHLHNPAICHLGALQEWEKRHLRWTNRFFHHPLPAEVLEEHRSVKYYLLAEKLIKEFSNHEQISPLKTLVEDPTLTVARLESWEKVNLLGWFSRLFAAPEQKKKYRVYQEFKEQLKIIDRIKPLPTRDLSLAGKLLQEFNDHPQKGSLEALVKNPLSVVDLESWRKSNVDPKLEKQYPAYEEFKKQLTIITSKKPPPARDAISLVLQSREATRLDLEQKQLSQSVKNHERSQEINSRFSETPFLEFFPNPEIWAQALNVFATKNDFQEFERAFDDYSDVLKKMQQTQSDVVLATKILKFLDERKKRFSKNPQDFNIRKELYEQTTLYLQFRAATNNSKTQKKAKRKANVYPETLPINGITKCLDIINKAKDKKGSIKNKHIKFPYSNWSELAGFSIDVVHSENQTPYLKLHAPFTMGAGTSAKFKPSYIIWLDLDEKGHYHFPSNYDRWIIGDRKVYLQQPQNIAQEAADIQVLGRTASAHVLYRCLSKNLDAISPHATKATVEQDILTGESLKSFCTTAKHPAPTLSVQEIWHITYQLLCELEKLNANGRIHGDIKPDNIMYDKTSKKASLIDLSTRRKGESFHTSGTHCYISPATQVNSYIQQFQPSLNKDDYRKNLLLTKYINLQHNHRHDIWGLSFTLLQLCGIVVWDGTAQSKIIFCEPKANNPYMPLYDFIMDLLGVNKDELQAHINSLNMLLSTQAKVDEFNALGPKNPAIVPPPLTTRQLRLRKEIISSQDIFIDLILNPEHSMHTLSKKFRSLPEIEITPLIQAATEHIGDSKVDYPPIPLPKVTLH